HFTPPQDYVKELPPGIEKILSPALEKDPARRYQRAREMADDMRRVVESTVSRDPLSETQSLSSTMVLPPAPPLPPPLPATRASRFSGWWSRSPPPAAKPPLPPVPGSEGSSVSTPESVPLAAPPPLPLPPPAVDPLADTLATAVTTAPAPAPRRPIVLGPLLAGVGSAALAVLLLYAGVLLWRGWSQPAAPPPPAAGEAEAQHKQARIMTFVNQGFAAMRKGQYDQAVAQFQQAEQLEPRREDIRRLR